MVSAYSCIALLQEAEGKRDVLEGRMIASLRASPNERQCGIHVALGLPISESASTKLAYVTVDDTESRRNGGPGAYGALQRLATYGTLAPGRPNHHQLDGLEGCWMTGYVDGILLDAGWGATLGYPALVLDPAGSAITVDVFESLDLPAHWARLDTFEGPGYERVMTTVHIPTGDVDASIYVLLQV
jgi:gamma-glutamylcyclotransferase (GGCT)/AIG2-like uncharacterized protein YtfP